MNTMCRVVELSNIVKILRTAEQYDSDGTRFIIISEESANRIIEGLEKVIENQH